MKFTVKYLLYLATFCLPLFFCIPVSYGRPAAKDAVQTAPATESVAVPDHDVQCENNKLAPDWKLIWDQARQLAREKKYREALVQYELLFGRKENIDEARWEYTTILIHLERWRHAETQLDMLTAHNPDNKNYLLALAQVSLAMGNVERAVKLYGQLYGQAPDSPEAVPALEGLIRALERQGQDEALLPLIEQLILRKPNDLNLQKKLARLSLKLNRTGKAGDMLQKLRQIAPNDPEVLLLSARLQKKLGHVQQAAVFWRRLVALEPGNQEGRRQLMLYYRDWGNGSMELKQIEALLKNNPGDIGLLDRGAELNMELGRADRALEYYDCSLALKPDDKAIVRMRHEAQKVLARDFLALVENNGSRMLWHDLVKVTADRPGVYRAIADLLREQGKVAELIDVLTIIHQEDPGDKQAGVELADLLEKQGRVNEARLLRKEMNRAGKINKSEKKKPLLQHIQAECRNLKVTVHQRQ
ncbi:tetratricopeptide repeat protein [bacterium BMS3Bbin14]|nr:tetratricopeptide repeat protein [bacterium BMS3Abin13]GBE53839.1 tetratricopeptide repeat protein [bacterium BMS3Bbin14]